MLPFTDRVYIIARIIRIAVLSVLCIVGAMNLIVPDALRELVNHGQRGTPSDRSTLPVRPTPPVDV